MGLPALPLVLNVDDRPATLYTRNRLLTANGFRVVNATTASETLRIVRHSRPQVILLDVHLPDADGRDLCQRLKADADLRTIPVVLISATLSGHRDYVEAVGWAGADAFVVEPYEEAALVSTLRAVMSAA